MTHSKQGIAGSLWTAGDGVHSRSGDARFTKTMKISFYRCPYCHSEKVKFHGKRKLKGIGKGGRYNRRWMCSICGKHFTVNSFTGKISKEGWRKTHKIFNKFKETFYRLQKENKSVSSRNIKREMRRLGNVVSHVTINVWKKRRIRNQG